MPLTETPFFPRTSSSNSSENDQVEKGEGEGGERERCEREGGMGSKAGREKRREMIHT